MKKLLLAAFVLASAAFSAKAQQGSVLVYGSLGLQTQSANYVNLRNVDGESGKGTCFSIAPGVGYQFNKNWTAGLELGFSSNKSGDAKAENLFNVGPFVRYSQPISDIFSIYGQAGVGFESYKQDQSKASGVYVSVVPAISANIKNGFALNFGFGGLSFENTKVKDGDAGSSFGVNFGKSFNIGVSKNFGGKK
ncbi:outer membrane beta-barrel protein [Pinibacter soli]|uniref:Outer membrane beta-barrel protein n=1 Tax=Pinibacter soli TaxID=3044211 RepID=A0ABT6R785_9BACT|nr:outer membrane beta-barrel protein [Pinibacter soli]MDI3318306.1 outer membrane beta-barrel protein [Pinibacter soli]